NQLRVAWLRPERGVIYDRNGTQLVRNVPSFTISIVRADLPRPAEPVYANLGHLLGMPPEQIKATVNEQAEQFDICNPIPTKRHADFGAVAFIKERPHQFAGVDVGVDAVREYVDGPAFAHVLGYVGPMSEDQYDLLRRDPERRYTPADRVGQAGIESLFERDRRGSPAEIQQGVDSTGRAVTEPVVQKSWLLAKNVVLTLDAKLQRRAAEILGEHIDRYGTASAIV